MQCLHFGGIQKETMTEVKTPTPTPLVVRMPDELRLWLKQQAVDNRRSLNSEVLFRLEESRRQQEKAHAQQT